MAGNGTLAVLEKYWAWLYAGAAAVLLALLLRQHALIVFSEFPLEYYEGTQLLITGLLGQGENPFTREFQPQAMYVYPPLYNLLVAPLTWVFDNTLQLHRLVSGLLILASCALCARAVTHCGGAWRHGLAAAATLYAALLYYGTPVASTNALGVCLYLLILYLPWRHQFSVPSLAAACVLGVLAFYAKQYFILAVAMLCLYLFLYVSMRAALILGFSFAVLLFGSLLVIDSASPYYLDNTLFAPAVAITMAQSPAFAAQQFLEFCRLYWPLLLIVGVLQARRFLRTDWHGDWRTTLSAQAFKLRWRRADSQSGERRPPTHYFWFCLLWASLVVLFYLGRNPGNYMTYLFQLLSPCLLVAGFGLLCGQASQLKALAPLLLICFFQVYAFLPRDFSTTEEGWRRADRLVAEHDELFTSHLLIPSLLKHGRRVEHDGHTFYFFMAAYKPQFLEKPRPEDRIAAVWDDYLTSLYRKIEARQYDLVLITPWDGLGIFKSHPPPFSDKDGLTFLQEYYYPNEVISLSMTERPGGGVYSLQVWRPIAGSTAEP